MRKKEFGHGFRDAVNGNGYRVEYDLTTHYDRLSYERGRQFFAATKMPAIKTKGRLTQAAYDAMIDLIRNRSII